MVEGIVKSLKILGLIQGMGYRGSKSDSHISVKEQRADGSSIFFEYCKVCSKCQGNLVYNHWIRNVNTIKVNKYWNYWIIQRSLFSTKASSVHNTTDKLNPNYVTGFTDGEGCFFVGISSDSRYKTGYRIKAIFQIGVHEKDLALLKQIKLFFRVGHITKLGVESVQYRVSGLKDLNLINNHFDLYPLLTRKQSDFLLFKEVIDLMKEGKHLTLEGLKRIISIKITLNGSLAIPLRGIKEISDTLSLAFSDLEPALLPKINETKIQDLHWLAGFTDAEGCFFIALKKSPESKLGEAVWLRFILSQHSKDKDLLESLIFTFNCGRYVSKPDCGEFIVEKFSDVRDKVIPIFEEFKLYSLKSKNYEDFKKAAVLINNKAHLTRKGLDEIKEIKGGMNKRRK